MPLISRAGAGIILTAPSDDEHLSLWLGQYPLRGLCSYSGLVKKGDKFMPNRVVHVFAVLLGAAMICPAWAEEPRGLVEGDRELLDVLSAAQATGQASFPHGALTAEVHTTHIGGALDEEVDIKADVVWSESSTYWKYKQTLLLTGQAPEITEAEMIQTKALLMAYWADRKMAMIYSDELGGYRPELRLRPDQRWFVVGSGSRRWSELFDAGTPDRPPKVKLDKLEVSAEGDQIVVRRYVEGHVLRITASPKFGGNVVDYEAPRTSNDPMWYRGTYEWKKLPDNRFWLKHYEYVMSTNGDNSHPNQTYELTVTDFNPEPTIASDRFRFESLRVPEGTLIEEVSNAGNKRRRQGEKAPTRQELLDELADGLRRKGFAAVAGDQEKP